MEQTILDICLKNHNWIEGKKYHPLQGFCYYASEAYYYLSDNKNNLIFMYNYTDIIWNNVNIIHFWLKDIEQNKIIDITKSQFKKNINYDGFIYYPKTNICLITKKIIEVVLNGY